MGRSAARHRQLETRPEISPPEPPEDTLAFTWNDPFLIDDQLTEDERMIRDAAAAFAKAELLPRVQDAYLEEKTDIDLDRKSVV